MLKDDYWELMVVHYLYDFDTRDPRLRSIEEAEKELESSRLNRKVKRTLWTIHSRAKKVVDQNVDLTLVFRRLKDNEEKITNKFQGVCAMTDKRSPQEEIIYQFQKIRLKQKALHHVREGTKEQLQAFRKIQEQDLPHVEEKLADVERDLHIEGYFHEEVAILSHPTQRLIQEAEEKLMAYQGELEILEQEEDRLLKEAKEMERQLKMDN